jgi:tetratricopeptide (TPR) repeat protein
MMRRNSFATLLLLAVGAMLCSFRPDSVDVQGKYDYYFLEASRLKEAGDYSATYAMLQHCLELRPDAPSALYEISNFYRMLNKPQAARRALEKAVAGAPDNYWYADALSNFYYQSGQKDKATALLESLMQRFPARQERLATILLEVYGSENDYDKQIAILDSMESRLGVNEDISMTKYQIYLAKKDTAAAFSVIEGLVAKYPLDMRYLTTLGDTYMQHGQPEEAYATYMKALQAEPRNTQTLLSLANYYMQTGQTEKYHRQIDSLLLGDNALATAQKSEILRMMVIQNNAANDRDSLRLRRLFAAVIPADTADVSIPTLYAQYLFSQKKEQEAVPVLEYILRHDPSDDAIRMTLLQQAVAANDLSQIIRVCRPGILHNPAEMRYYYYLGVASYQQDSLQVALHTFREAVAHAPTDTDAKLMSDFHSIMGDISHTLGRMSDAYAAYDSALVYNPDNVGALNNYAYYLSLERRDLARAAEMSFRTVRAEPNNPTYLDTYAWILFEQKNYGQAKLYIDQALKAIGDATAGNEVVIEHAGDIYSKLDERAAAVELWKRAASSGTPSPTLLKKIKKKKYIRP